MKKIALTVSRLTGVADAFTENTVGTKVKDPVLFFHHMNIAVTERDFETQKCPGQAKISVQNLIPYISCGVGLRTKNPSDFIPRLHRGVVEMFLKREFAERADDCSIVVYTRAAYLNDPQVKRNLEEVENIEVSDCTHVLVAIIGSAGPDPQVSNNRFVSGLAGDNNESALWSLEEIHNRAREVRDYNEQWCTVAD